MAATRHAPDQIVKLGKDLYEREIRRQVEAHNEGKMIAIDVDSGAYALADDSLTAINELSEKMPQATIYVLRVGFPTAVKIGAGRKPTTP
jgi:hypothetical protein